MANEDLKVVFDADAAGLLRETRGVVEALQKLNREIGRSGTDLKKLDTGFDAVGQRMRKLTSSLKGLAKGYLGYRAILEGIDMAKAAADAQQAAEAFEKIFSEMGLNAQEEFDKIKKASMGLIPDSAIKQASVTAASLGVPAEKLAGLMEVAVAKSREMGTSVTSAFNDLATGIGRGSTQILDNLGLEIKLGDAYAAMAKEVGKSVDALSAQEKQQALTNAVLKEGADAVKRYAASGLSAKQELMLLDAQMQNLSEQIGEALLPPMMDLVEATTKWIASLDQEKIKSFQQGIRGVGATAKNLWSILKKIDDAAMPDALANKKDAGYFETVAEFLFLVADRYGFAAEASDRLAEAMKKTNKVLLENEAVEGDSVEAIYRKNKSISDQLLVLAELRGEIEKFKGWGRYEERAKEMDEAIRTLREEQAKNIEEMQRLKDLGDPYAEVSEGANRAADATIRYSEETIKAIKKDNDARIKNAESTIAKLIKQEQRLSTDITKINTDLQQKLAGIERSRVARMEAIENKIREIRRQGMTDVAQVDDLQRQRDEDLSKARQALAAGDLESYRRYAREYEAILGQIEQKQADSNSAAYTGANAAREAQINGLKTLEQMENQYFAAKKAQAIAVAEAAKIQKQTELESVKAQLEAQKELLNVSKQLAEALTGKTIDLDTSAIDRAIGKISETQRKLSELSTTKGNVSVDTTQVTEAQQQVQTLKSMTINGVTMRVDADTTPADFGIQKLITVASEDEISMQVNPEWEAAKKQIDSARASMEHQPVDMKLTADTAPAKHDIGSVATLANATKGRIHVDADTSRALSAIHALEKPTYSVHTVYVKEVEEHASGGLVGTPVKKYAVGGMVAKMLAVNNPMKGVVAKMLAENNPMKGMVARYASGGSVWRSPGKVPGHDVTDSDSVRALLTEGEFVMRRKAVDFYGPGLMHAINSLKMPKIPSFSDGGNVGSSAAPSGEAPLQPINLHIGDQTFSVMSDRSVADALARYLKHDGAV